MKTLRGLRGALVMLGSKALGRAVIGRLSGDMRRLDGIWLEGGLGTMRFLDAEQICVIGEKTIIADAPGERLRIKPCPLLVRAVSDKGMQLGAITDAEIDETSLAICALTLSTGYLDSIIRGSVRITNYEYDSENRRVIIAESQIDMEV